MERVIMFLSGCQLISENYDDIRGQMELDPDMASKINQLGDMSSEIIHKFYANMTEEQQQLFQGIVGQQESEILA